MCCVRAVVESLAIADVATSFELELEASRELNNPRRVSVTSRDLTKGRAVDVEDIAVFTKAGRVGSSRSKEVHVVENIENFHAQLESCSFTEGDVLHETRVPIEVHWSIDESARQISSLTWL